MNEYCCLIVECVRHAGEAGRKQRGNKKTSTRLGALALRHAEVEIGSTSTALISASAWRRMNSCADENPTQIYSKDERLSRREMADLYLGRADVKNFNSGDSRK